LSHFRLNPIKWSSQSALALTVERYMLNKKRGQNVNFLILEKNCFGLKKYT